MILFALDGTLKVLLKVIHKAYIEAWKYSRY